MIKIYDINDKLLMQAEVTSAAKREQEMSKSDYISLSFSAAEKVILPAGAYINYTYKIDTVREVTRKFLLLESYEPIQSDECSWKYTPQFQHPKMILSKTPFFIYTRNSQNVEVKQNVWSFVGTTSALSGRIADFLNKDLMFGECGWKVIFQKVTANTINVSFSDNDFISALTAITNAIGDNCEWHIDYDDEIIYIGKVLVGAIPVILEVGKNVGVPSINESKEGYYNAFSIFGGTRNITQVNSKGENVSSGDIRLQLDEGNGTITIDGKECSYSIDKYSTLDLRADKTKEPLFVKVLNISQIYPSLNTYVYNVRGRVKYVLDENKKKIPISYNADGSVKEYKTFTVWYMRLAYPTTEKVAGKTIINTTVDDGVTHYWYNFEVTDDLLINGKNIGCSFEANFNTGALSTPLAGRGTNGDYVGFELIYHKEASSSHTSDDVSKDNFSVLAGDYEIIYQQDNEVIIPTNKEEMLIPRGENKPSLKCNITVLYNIAMANTIYYEDAQNRLLEKAKEEIVRLLSDLNNYEVKSYSDVFLEENPQLQIGQSVTYKDGHGYELATRVLKLSTNIDYDFIQSITLGNQAIKGTITQLKEDVQTIIANGGNSGNGGGFSVSQLRSLIAKYGSDNFISKQFDDIAHGTITWEKIQKLLSGLLVGGFNNENGGSWTPDAEGRSHLITDYLEVRMKAIFEELAIKKNSTIGGKEIISPAGGVAAYKVDEVTVTYKEVSQKAYRCYFLAEQDGDEVDNDFVVEDQVRSESFNLNAGKYHKTGNHFFWRMVIGIDEEPVELEGKKYHYIDLSDTDCATASDVPAKGDVLSQCGNRTDVERQNCLIFSAVDTYSPSISLYHGINSYSFANKEYVEYGVNKQTNKAFFNVYGDMYVGDRPTKDNGYEGSSYVKYDSATKQVVIKGKLSAKSTVDGKELSQYIKENSAKGLTEEQVNNIINNSQVIADLQNQVDGAIETWFYDGVPTLTNAPASSWTTNKDKDTHLGDLYYDNKTGKAYRFAKDGNTYKWTIITDTDIAKALADASKAQETADGKMKVFSSQPTPPYQVGDIWVNATYPSDGSTYKNEVLRCQTDKKAGSQFAIADWIKASKYTDDTVANAAKKAAEEAKKAAETAQTNITNLGKTVTINKKAFDSYVKDGYLEPSEIAAMAQDSKRLEDDFAAAEKSYNEVKGAEVLKSTKELTDLNTAFATLTTAKTELVTYLSDISSRYNAADTNGKVTIVSAVGTKFTNFQSAYSAFYDKLGLANAYITSKIYGDLKQNITDLAGYKYIKDALGQTTDIDGGLVMTTLLALRDADGNIQSGINGAIDTNRGKKSIATWWGGQMVDKDYNSGSLTPATSLVRFDGSGYLANGAIWWDVDGKVHADPTSFIISEKNLGAYLAFFEPTWKSGSNGTNIKDLVALTPQAPFTTLSVSNDLLVEGKLKIGSITLSVVNGALKIDGNVYSTGGMSAYGEGTSNGGGLNGSIVPFDKAKSLTAQNEGTEIASAWSIKKLYDMINSIDVTGQLADYLKKTEASTLYQPKGNYLTSHQDISGKSDKTHTHSVKINGVTKTIAATGGTAVDLGTYLTSHQSLAAYLKSADAEKTYSKLGHTHAFSEITGKPTTLAGYGVTDGVNAVSVTGNGNAVTSASIDGHTLTLTKGSTFSLSGHTHTFASLTSKPTTIAGYGITDAYTKAQVDSTIAKYLPLAGGTITGALTVNGIATFKSKVAIGNIYIINDGSGNLYVQKTDGKTAANFYATGGITAFGASSVSGGTGGGLNGSVLGFEKATAMTSADNGDSSKTEVSFLATAWSIKQLNDKINAFGTGVFSDYLTIAAAKATYQPKGSYLTSHQTIYGLTIQKNGTSLGTYTPNSAAKTINVTVPTKLSELSNDSGYTKNTGTVTSVAISVPTGLSVSGSPITTHGTIAIALASGYSIPTTAKQTNWDKVYNWYTGITATDTDDIINKWQEVISFLDGISSSTDLNAIVDGINTSISNEVTRAKAAESTLTTNLNSEITRAKSAESTLTTNLNAEITRAKSAESTLTTNLNNEITRAKNAENTLNNKFANYLPLAGGTMTGVLALKSGMYKDAYNGALNMQNSDIFGLNSIYTSDKSDSQAEGIHFYRDATHVDTLRMMDGKLLFTPNRELGKTATEYEVIHSGTIGNQSVNYAKSAGNADTLDNIHASGLFTALANSGNNISVTIGGTNKTLTVGYATKAAQLNTARTLWGNSFDGTANISGQITFPNVTSGFANGVKWQVGDNDFAIIRGGATASDGGYLEIATADGTNEPIYVRQYSNVFTTIKRTLTLLDASGNTILPGKLNIGGIVVEYDATNKALKVNGNLYATGGITAYGEGSAGTTGSNNFTAKAYADSIKLTSENLSEIASAYSIAVLNNSLNAAIGRISTLEGGSATSIETTGSGNAVTSVSKSGTKITFTKGSTFSLNGHTHTFASLTSKPTSLSGYGITDGVNAVSVTGSGNAVTAASVSGHTLTLTKGSSFSLSNHTHYIGTTQVQGSSAEQALTGITKIDNILKLSKATVTVNTSYKAEQNRLVIYGTTYGNDANYIKSAGKLSYGDGGPQLVFSTSEHPDASGVQSAALVYTDHDTIGAGVSLSFVTNQGDAYFIAPHIKALTAFQGNLAWSYITNKPTTLSGFGITDGLRSVTQPSGSNVFVTGISTSGTAITYTKSYTKKSLTAVGASGWTNASTDGNIIPDMSFIAYWNGAYSGTSSNLAYCNKGAFGSFAIKNSLAFSELTSKPTTISGYGITDAYTKAQVDSTIAKYLPLAGGTITGALTVNGIATFKSKVAIGNIYIINDGSGNLYVQKTDGKTAANFYATGGITAYGEGSAGTTGSNNFTAKAYADSIKLTSENLSEIASAYSIAVLNNSLNAAIGRISTLEGGSATSIETTGSGNAVTSVSKSGTKITFTKGSTFSLNGHTHTFASLTSKPTSLSGYGITDGVNAVSVTGSGNAVTAASVSGHTLTLTKGSSFSLSNHTHYIGTTQVQGSSAEQALTGITKIDNILKLSKATVTVNTSYKAEQNRLVIYGTTYGNDANYIKSAGKLSYGDGGPQLVFSTSEHPDASGVQSAALVYTDHDTIGAGVSLSFVTNQGDAYFIAPHIKALTAFQGNLAWSYITNKPTTLSGFGITDGLRSVTQPSGSNVFVTGISTSGTAITYTKSYTKKSLTAVGASGWTNASTDGNIIPDMSFIAYWNGAYSGTSSNLAYCNKGAFGSFAIKNSLAFSELTSKPTTISGYGITDAYTKTQVDAIAAKYLPLTGGTLTGQLKIVASALNGAYNGLLIGDDCYIGDCNLGNTIGLMGVGNNNAGMLKFGKGGMQFGYNGSNHIASTTAQWTNLNADLLDGWHKDNIVWSGAVNSNTASLSHYWAKLFDITVTGNLYDDRSFTFLFSNGYSDTYSVVVLKIRQNGAKDSGAYNFNISLRELVGNMSSRLRVYYNNATGNVQLWGNCQGQYGSLSYTIIKKTGRTSADFTSQGTLVTNTSFSAAQSLPATTGDSPYTLLDGATRIGIVKQADQLVTARSLWGQSFNGTANVSGNMTGVGNINTSAAPAGTIYTNNWFRSKGSTGWYSEDHGGGWYMSDNTWIRNFGSKDVYLSNKLSVNGNVGIGTTAPSHKLHVSGEIYTTTKVNINGIILEKDSNGDLKVNGNLYATGGISAYGTSSAGSGGGLSGSVLAWDSAIKMPNATNGSSDTTKTESSFLASAWSIKQLYNKVTSLEGGSAMNVSVSGSGNAVTSITKNGTTISVVKGSTFSLSGHTHKWADITDRPSSLKNPSALSWSGYSSGSYDGSAAKSISIPNNTNQLTNGAGFITASASITGNAATATKVNHSLSVFGKSFNGSADVTVADTDLITSISTATANLTDKTEILTSYASDNGFNDSNAKNRIHRRPASAIWGYINSKTISNADKLDNVHLNGIFTALSNTNNGVSMTIGTVAKSLANMQVYSATKLVTARNIALGHDFRGSANFDGSGNITINGHINSASINLGSTDPNPFKRIAHVQTANSWNDNALLLYLSQGYVDGNVGICRVEFRTSNVTETGSARVNVRWLVRYGYATDSVQVGYYSAKGNSYMDVFVKTTGGYQGTVIRCLQDSRGGINSNVSLFAATQTTEAYTSIEAAAKALYNLAYTSIVKGFDVGAVNYANSAGNSDTLDGIHANGLFTNLSNSGNNLSITIGGTNKTLTVNYASNAGNADTVDSLHVHSGRNSEANKIVRTDGNGFIQCGYINSDKGNEGNNSSPARVWGTNGSDNYLRSYLTSALSVKYAASAGNADTLDGVHASGLFTNLSNSGNNISITIGGTNKTLTAAYATNCDTVDGYHAGISAKPYGTIPAISSSGIIELGHYIDFHHDNTTGSDYSVRLQTNGNHSNVVTLPTATGTLALTTDNVASATKLQTARTIWGQSFNGTANVSGALSGATTISASNTISTTLQNGALKIGNKSAPISAIDAQVIFNTGAAVRFGETAWDWNQWAGLKYTHSNKTVYLGIADGSVFNANNAQSGGKLQLKAIDRILFDSDSDSFQIHCDNSNDYLRIGSSDNSGYVLVSDIGNWDTDDNGDDTNNWLISIDGTGTFKSIYCPGIYTANSIISTRNKALLLSGNVIREYHHDGSPYYSSITFNETTLALNAYGNIGLTSSHGITIEGGSGTISMVASGGFDVTYHAASLSVSQTGASEYTWTFNNGSIKTTGGITAYQSSDERLKHNIHGVDSLAIIKAMGGTVAFRYNEDDKASIGWIAQRVLHNTLMQDLVEKDEDGYLKINYWSPKLIAVAFGAIEQVDDEVAKLKARVRELENEVEQLKSDRL